MKNLITTLVLTIVSMTLAICQEDNSVVDASLGLRIIRNGQDYMIYADSNLCPNFKDYRKLNYLVYFRKIDFPIKEIEGKKYQLISIPGSSRKQYQNGFEKSMNAKPTYPRTGKTVNKEDYDQNFWIETNIIEEYTEIEHYKYANDVFSGLLTAPFKYRLKQNNVPESFIDGAFNIAPFIGWKCRISSSKPYYLAPFGFTGITTLNYNSANNSNISAPDKLEVGAGITYGLGLSFKFGSVSPGFIVGWDHGLGDLGNGFKYSDKMWISFSINYDFFKPNKTSEGEQK